MKNRILIVDDVVVNTIILEKMIKESGYDADIVQSGKLALEMTKKHKYSIILLDVIMPEMDGFEVLKQLKMDYETSNIPVILISGSDNHKDILTGFELGAADFITKPFHLLEVKARIRSHVKLFVTLEKLAHSQSEILKEVSKTQNYMLKKPKDFPTANFNVYYKSLHAAGGDIYDIIKYSDDVTGYFVGDFSGHSISTGFLTSAIIALLHQNCIEEYSAEESMTLINKALCDLMPTGVYLTAVYVIVDRRDYSITAVNMGHPPILIIGEDGKVEEVGRGGDLLGIFYDATFSSIKRDVIEGDKVFLYTDGLIESDDVWNSKIDTLIDECSLLSMYKPESFIENIMVRTEKIRKENNDDILALIISV